MAGSLVRATSSFNTRCAAPESIDMTYWYGRSLEQRNDTAAAIKAYSQVAQWDFNYKDTQVRIKRLRSAPTPT